MGIAWKIGHARGAALPRWPLFVEQNLGPFHTLAPAVQTKGPRSDKGMGGAHVVHYRAEVLARAPSRNSTT